MRISCDVCCIWARIAGLFVALSLDAATAQEPPAQPDPSRESQPEPAADRSLFAFLRGQQEPYTIVSVADGLSAHKPSYLLPFTYSPDLNQDKYEVVFQLSAKQRLFDRDLFFGYTQKSLWQFYSQDDSAPFRETVYNPELFYRWTPDPLRFYGWGADLGLEHESNGQSLPTSRSWNRLYVAPFQARSRHLLHFKLWYRLPEDRKETPEDARGDDNPDIYRYYGYAELRMQRQFDKKGRHAALMVRGNPASGKGAFELMLSQPKSDRTLFYCLSLWHGYGESLIDYNRSVTRIGLGIMLAR